MPVPYFSLDIPTTVADRIAAAAMVQPEQQRRGIGTRLFDLATSVPAFARMRQNYEQGMRNRQVSQWVDQEIAKAQESGDQERLDRLQAWKSGRIMSPSEAADPYRLGTFQSGLELSRGRSLDDYRRQNEMIARDYENQLITERQRQQAELENRLALGRIDREYALRGQLESNRPRNVDPLQRQVLLESLKNAAEQIEKADTTIDTLAQIDASLARAEQVLKEGRVRTGRFAGSSIGALAQKVGSEEDVNALEQAFGNQWIQAVQGMRGLGQLSDREGQALSRTTGGLDKDEQFNLRDIQARREQIRKVIERRQAERDLAVRNRQAVISEAGLGDALEAAIPRQPGSSLDRGAPGTAPKSPVPQQQGEDVQMVQVRAPDGRLGWIPRAALPQARADGLVPVR